MTCSPEAALAARPRAIDELSTLIRQAVFLSDQVEVVNERSKRDRLVGWMMFRDYHGVPIKGWSRPRVAEASAGQSTRSSKSSMRRQLESMLIN